MSDTLLTPNVPARTWSEYLPTASRVRIAVIALLLAMVFWDPIRQALWRRWMVDPNWSHGWLIPLFSVYFLYSHRQRLFAAVPRANYWGAVILVLSLAVYFLCSWRLLMSYPQAVALVGAIFGVTLLLGGTEVIRVAWFPIAFLLLAIPLPTRIYVNLTMPQQAFASTAAAAIMPLFASGLYTEAQSVVIDYIMPGRAPGQLNVEEACSGMRLMMAFVTLGVAMAYLGERPAWQRLIMVLSCVPIALLCNTIRVTVTGLLYIYGHEDLAKGTPHTLLGIAMLAVALGCYFLIGLVLSRLFIEDKDEVEV